MAEMIYAVVRRKYGNYNDDDSETLLRMFASHKEADEYIRGRVMVFRPVPVYDSADETITYEYGMPDTENTVSKVEFPQYVIRRFYVEDNE